MQGNKKFDLTAESRIPIFKLTGGREETAIPNWRQGWMNPEKVIGNAVMTVEIATGEVRDNQQGANAI